jgi:hypothetical protein
VLSVCVTPNIYSTLDSVCVVNACNLIVTIAFYESIMGGVAIMS